MGGPIRLVTWNVQGRQGLDVAAVRALLEPWRPDVIALQEVQSRQCRRLAEALGMRSRWAFKHWPFPYRREGIAVLTRHDLVDTDAFVLRRAMPWSWRRRIALRATVVVAAQRVEVVVVHLSPHDSGAARARELERVLGEVEERRALIVGDLNDHPDGSTSTTLAERGWRDAWTDARGDDDGPTNWSPGPRHGRRPDQRIDYVFAPSGCRIERSQVLDEPLDQLAVLSDHLPLLVDVEVEAAA